MRTAAILPIFNEEKTVANVLAVLLKAEQLDEVIVVDDASTDNSLNIVKSFQSDKLKIIHLKKNLGKSGAVKIAVKKTTADILFFCDGDLHNFTIQHLNQLLEPLKEGGYLMTVGIRDRGAIHNAFVKKFGPLISGERALPRKIFTEVIDHPLLEGYAMEFILNDYCAKNNIPTKRIVLKGVSQTIMPYKRKNGIILLAKEFFKLISVFIKLKYYDWTK